MTFFFCKVEWIFSLWGEVEQTVRPIKRLYWHKILQGDVEEPKPFAPGNSRYGCVNLKTKDVDFTCPIGMYLKCISHGHSYVVEAGLPLKRRALICTGRDPSSTVLAGMWYFYSSVCRALHWHGRGHGLKSRWSHLKFSGVYKWQLLMLTRWVRRSLHFFRSDKQTTKSII